MLNGYLGRGPQATRLPFEFTSVKTSFAGIEVSNTTWGNHQYAVATAQAHKPIAILLLRLRKMMRSDLKTRSTLT
jgi:hypothetical protein